MIFTSTHSIQPHMIRSYHLTLVISLFLTLATVASFWQLSSYDFITIDDNVYVTNNAYVDEGLTAKSIRWAFTTMKAEFWHPLTWLSLMADSQIFGGSPAGYHLTNLLLHIMNTLLLFFFLRKTTGKLWQSGFAASLFALHPLHVALKISRSSAYPLQLDKTAGNVQRNHSGQANA